MTGGSAVRGDPRRRHLAALLAGTLATGCTSAAPDVKPSQVTVRIATAMSGGGFLPLANHLAGVFRQTLPHLTIETVSSAGGVANIEALQRGDADLGLAFADVTYLSFQGRWRPGEAPYDRLRAVAVMQLTPVQLVVRQHSHIRDVADLRGHRVGVGPPGSGTAVTADLVLTAFGVKPTDVRAETLPFKDAADRMIDGTLDAMFDDAIYPAEAILTAVRAGARLLPLHGVPIERLRHQYPFFRRTTIPRGAYLGATSEVHTIGVDSLLICRQGLDEGLVYDLTRVFFEALPSQPFLQDALRFMDLDQAPATPIPLHEGAARYYRQRELMR